MDELAKDLLVAADKYLIDLWVSVFSRPNGHRSKLLSVIGIGW
jgi:hypothetical protein